MSSNYAAPGAHVGVQVDGDVVIEGGIHLGASGITVGRATSGRRGGRPEPDGEGTVNVAGDGDTVAVQAGRVHGRKR